MEYFALVFIAALLVDIIPFFGPPAWTVIMFLQVRYNLDIWPTLVVGVAGSAVGRYIYSLYIPLISDRFLKQEKTEDLKFIGSKLQGNDWKVYLFVVLYTALPLPSTPLFTAAGISRINTLKLMPAFFVGKFIIDAIMVSTGSYIAGNASDIVSGMVNWETILGTIASVVVVVLFLCIDWRKFLEDKRLSFNFHIFK